MQQPARQQHQAGVGRHTFSVFQLLATAGDEMPAVGVTWCRSYEPFP